MHRAAKLADLALAAAQQQTVALPPDPAATLTAELAGQLRKRIRDTDKAIEAGVDSLPRGAVLRSLPGAGVLVAAEFTVAVSDLSTFLAPTTSLPTPGWLRSDATPANGSALAPAAALQPPAAARPQLSALATLKPDGPNRTYDQRK